MLNTNGYKEYGTNGINRKWWHGRKNCRTFKKSDSFSELTRHDGTIKF